MMVTGTYHHILWPLTGDMYLNQTIHSFSESLLSVILHHIIHSSFRVPCRFEKLYCGFRLQFWLTKLKLYAQLYSWGDKMQVFEKSGSYYRPQTKFAKVMFLRSLSVQGRGVEVSVQGGSVYGVSVQGVSG